MNAADAKEQAKGWPYRCPRCGESTLCESTRAWLKGYCKKEGRTTRLMRWGIAEHIEHWKGRATRAEAKIAAYEMPVSDAEWRVMEEKYARTFTSRGAVDVLIASRKLPPPAITEQDAKEGM